MPVDDAAFFSSDPTAAPAVAGDAFVVRVLPSQRRFAADALTTVWQAARDAGLRLPSSCRNGTCRSCLSRLVQGRVAYHIEWPGVSRDEQAEGCFLPCVAYPESDLVIEATVLDGDGLALNTLAPSP